MGRLGDPKVGGGGVVGGLGGVGKNRGGRVVSGGGGGGVVDAEEIDEQRCTNIPELGVFCLITAVWRVKNVSSPDLT